MPAPDGGRALRYVTDTGVYNSFSGLKLRIEAFFGSECFGVLILGCKISMGIFFKVLINRLPTSGFSINFT